MAVGDVVRASTEEEAELYAACSRDLQLLAWLNDPEVARLPRPERVARWRAFDAAHPDLAPPTTWLCFHLVPRQLTFWRGDDEAPSTRDEYARAAEGWSFRRLPG
ncbi:hypothetical protein [Mumia sp. Pv 4-285]|uniref:hypothetical protein n=1 Tax=Mumia qirimensis TaxID=3234852 RepID=UPI00351D1C8E